jgi:predicted RND superfamily exporter protein
MEKIFKKSLKFSWAIIGVVIVVSVFFFLKMKENSRMETNLDEYMPQDHPAFVYSNKAEKWFNIKDGIIVAVENKDGIYNYETLKIVKDLSKKFMKMPEIEKNDVTSLYTADNIVGTEDGMDVRRFYKRVPKTPEKLKELREKVRNNNMIYGMLVDSTETVTVIVARIGDDVFTQEFYERILNTAKKYENDKNKIYVAGRPIVEGTLALLGPADMKRMVPIVLIVIFIVLFVTLRSLKSTIATMLVVFVSTLWAFGLMATVNIPIYAVSTMIPVMLIAIGVAYGIHLYHHLALFMEENPDASKDEAIVDMLVQMWKPVTMAAVTTAVGFISLLTSQVYPIKYFGLFTAFGVTVAMFLSLFFIPAFIHVTGLPRLKFKKKTESQKENQIAYVFTEKVLEHSTATILITAVIVVLSIYGMTKVWINSSFLDKFEKTSDIVKTDAFINEHFGGTSTINLILDGKEKDTFKRPEVLKLVEKMQKDVVHNVPVVGNVFSLVDFLERINRVMHADSVEYERVPDNQDLIAQYLLLYEMSGDPENLTKVVDYNYQKLNVTFQLKSDDSKATKAALAAIDKYKDDFAKLGVTLNYAGSGYKALVFTDLILEGQIMSLVMSIAIVFVLLLIMFRNLKVSIIGTVPILITAIISFGVMGWLDIPLNSTTALLSSIAVGIGIDYAIHFIEQYRVNSKLGDKLLASKITMDHSGKAILFNAIVVIAGFLVLLFSVFPPNRELGALVSLNMFTSFLGTLTIMFLLLYKSNVYYENKNKGESK